MSVYAIIVGHWSSEEAAKASTVGHRELNDVLLRIEKAVCSTPPPED